MIYPNKQEIEGHLIRQIELGRQGAPGTAYRNVFEDMYTASKAYTNWRSLRGRLVDLEDVLQVYLDLYPERDQSIRDMLRLPKEEYFTYRDVPLSTIARIMSMSARIRAFIDIISNDPLPDRLLNR
ncbi:hypothetical protein [Ktedonospora formicarum]|uniref:Uncharacterized protein n=1 Tax=Ktedonospora formicarum TaxID=2778364 RepID=A0A8J3MYJ0_9CHLR|nr:hypothetical protein [Ktedonospora formicarum]GHO50863.1 hypothetical protein KSX_90260 [Ktedonospora formicarum]